VLLGVIGPKSLAQQIKEELAIYLDHELKLTLNPEKTRLLHLKTKKATFLGYEFKASTARLRRRNLRRKGSAHNIVQTVKTNVGNIKLLVPLRSFAKKLKPYMIRGKPTHRPELVNQSVESIIAHYNAVLRGWYNYYQLAENVGRLNYGRYVLRYSLAKTIAHKEKITVHKVFRRYGKPITVTKANGRIVQFHNEPLIQIKKAKIKKAEVDQQPKWIPRRTRSRLLDNCALCGSTERIEMHHLRHIRKRGQSLQGFALYMAMINRKQIPVCSRCHRAIHNGQYDGPSLAGVLEKLPDYASAAEGAS
jgi:hypothetical protein